MTQIHPIPLDRCSLFLDFDGTLTPFAGRPDDISPDPEVAELLRGAYDTLDGRLAVVTGRSIADMDRLVQQAAPCIAGVHGLQRRTGEGEIEHAEAHPMLDEAAAVMQALAGAQVGLIVEPKGQAVAIHYRLAPTAEEALVECAERIAKATGLSVQRGNMVVELRTPGADKGAAVRAFMEDKTFANSTPIFIGDDLTDEAGFAEAARLGGFGVLVGAPRPTAARYRLDAPPQVIDWLASSLERKAFDPGDLKRIGAKWDA